MSEEFVKNPNECYRMAVKKADQYFQTLKQQVLQKTFVSTLIEDLQSWKQNHRPSLFSFLTDRMREPDSRNDHQYIQWLARKGKLDPYLNRSISYLFIRDLGKTLDSIETRDKVRRVVDQLKKHLTKRERNQKDFSIAQLYRWGEKEGIESTIIWLIDKLKTVSATIPKGMDPDHAQRKLLKIIAGVLMHEFVEMDKKDSPTERAESLAKAIRLGYSYGLTYPYIDDLLDANVLSENEKAEYSNIIRTALVTGIVPELERWPGNHLSFIRFIHEELREAFEYIKDNHRPDTLRSFFKQSYVFFQSQEVDRVKELSNPHYTNEEIYIPIILKSSYSRLIARSVMNAPEDEGFENRTFFYGIYNQLADDFADMFEDLNVGAVTPYTYYLKYHQRRPDLINPFEFYWTVIFHLIHHVYYSEPDTREVILDRAINGLKRFKGRMGNKTYNEVMELFAASNPGFNRVLQKMVDKAVDVDFFDKLLRDQMISQLKDERREREEFSETIKGVRQQINSVLPISTIGNDSLTAVPIIEAANYCLEGDGKRLRPIIAWYMGVNEYGLDRFSILPLLRSLEYMHTASLIFDDLPAQDNASFRRGRPTVHKLYNTATAELTGLFLTQKAIGEQTTLARFHSRMVLQLIHYSTKVTELMCMGQTMDVNSRGMPLTLEQLEALCFYKTGIAFEASLMMPAILAEKDALETEMLKKFAYHAGIAFQIKDDLLDFEGDRNLLGKPIGQDAEHNQSTFVTLLGADEARKKMWKHYCQGIEVLQEVQRKTPFLKQLLDYIVNREH
ncbi:polyprenyl synthetase family protein [Neobacillus sp. SM06]|uniref:polyprenyl synthetase family protein n=1 Tax=Neobacillus sp. SM06 TaxID=3422492 RepID=UPI003D27E86E